MYDMENFVVAGSASDPAFAKAERLAHLLMASLPDMRITIHNIHPSEWTQWLKSTCAELGFNHFFSPLIYTGTGVLVGGMEAFSELCEHDYGIVCDISKLSYLKNMAEENLKLANQVKLDEQVWEYLSRHEVKVKKLRTYGTLIQDVLEVLLTYKRAVIFNVPLIQVLLDHIDTQLVDPTNKQVTPDEAFYKKAVQHLKQTQNIPTEGLPKVEGQRASSKRHETMAEATGRMSPGGKTGRDSPTLQGMGVGKKDLGAEGNSILSIKSTGSQAFADLSRELEGLTFKLIIAADKFQAFRTNQLALFQKVPRPKNAYAMLNETRSTLASMLEDIPDVRETVTRIEILKTIELRKLLGKLDLITTFQEPTIPTWLLHEAKRVHAARILQAMWRGYKSRRRVEAMELEAYNTQLAEWQTKRDKRALKYNVKEAIRENMAPPEGQ